MMDNIDLLTKEALEIPVIYDDKNGYTSGIIKVLADYIEELRINGISSQILSKITGFKIPPAPPKHLAKKLKIT